FVCISSAEPARPEGEKQDGQQPAKKAAGGPVVQESAWNWGYFFAPSDKAAVEKLFDGRKHTVNLYQVDKVVAIRGEAGVNLKPGSTLVRVESAARLPATGEAKNTSLLFQGVSQHLEYTSRAVRDDLGKRSLSEFPASKDTIAVVIPIRKS